MDLIRQINSPDLFTSLVKALLSAEYKDFQTIDDSGGDAGNDGYSESHETLFQLYCTKKPEKVNDSAFKTKIIKDVEKANKLIASGKYKIKDWVFITPRELREPVQTFLRHEAKTRNMNGIAWASPKLIELFAKHEHLRSQFPELIQPDIENELGGIKERLDDVQDIKKKYRTKIEKSYNNRIDKSRQKLDDEKYETAKKEYELILSDLNSETEEIDSYIHFRVYNNLGVAELNLGNPETAAELFEKAYEAKPDLPMAICKLALSKLLKNIPAEGLEIIDKLLKEKPNYEHAITTKANILQSLGRFTELIPFLKEKGKVALVHWYEGFEKMSKNMHDEAMESFENFARLEPDNYRPLLLIAQNVMVGTQKFAKENPLPPDKLPNTIKNKFDRATECLKKAAQLLKNIENKTDLEMAYANLSGCYVALGLFEKSIATAEEAITLDKNSAVPFLNKGLAQLKLGLHKEAILSFQTYKKLGGGDIDVNRQIAYCSLKTGDLSTAEKIISSLLEGKHGLDLDIAELAVDLYSRKLDNEKLNPLLERLEKDFPNNSQALRLRGTYMQRLGLKGAEGLLQSALEYATSETDKIFTEIDLADLKFEQKNYSVAAELYKKHLNLQEGNHATTKYAECLYNQGQYGALLDWIDTLGQEVRCGLLVEQLEAYTNLYLGNLEKASRLFKNLFEKNPNSYQFVVYYGMCRFRLGNDKDAKAAYDAVKSKVDDASDLLTLAGGYQFIGEWDTAIELAYRALKNDSNNPQVHLAYISIFVKREQVDDQEPEKKYIKAFQKSIGEFNKRFPEEKALQGYEIKDNDISQILKVVDQMAETTDNATKLYRESQAPFAAVPRLTGKKPFDVWAAFTSMPGVGVKISFGTPDESELEMSTIVVSQNNSIVIDVYPLFLLAHLDSLELLPKIFGKIYVHQSIMDELTETIDDHKISVCKGVNSFAKINGQHTMTKITPEQVRKTIDLLEKVRSFISTEQNIEVRGFLKETSRDDRNIVNALHNSTRDSVLLAHELNVPFYCDDRLLRVVANRDYNLKSFSTQTLLIYALNEKFISIEKKFEHQKRLLDLNYDFISIDATFIKYQLKNTNYDVDKISNIATYITKKETNIESLAKVLADLFYILMLDNSITEHTKVEILQFILRKAESNHNLDNIEEGVFANLQGKVLPEKHVQLKQMIRLIFYLK